MSRSVGAVELGGTHVSAGRVAFDQAAVEERVRRDLPPDADRDELLARIVDAAAEVAANVDVVGVAVPGPFDYASGVSRMGHKLEALFGADLRTPLARRLDLAPAAVSFVNDADAFLLGEWWAGSAHGIHRVVGVTLGTGLGSAFLADGTIVDSGRTVPPAGEVHRLSYEGVPVERLVSRGAIIERYGRPGVDVKEIAIRARRGDERAAAAFEDVATALGGILEPWLEAFQATCLVVGGSIARAWDLLLPGLRSSLRHLDRLDSIVRAARLDEAPLLGAAYRASTTSTPREQATPAGGKRAPYVHPQVAELERRRRASGVRPLHELTVAEARAAQAAEPVARSDGYELETLDLEGPVPVRLYRPPSSEPLPTCIWLAGGGWVLDTLAAAESACRRISAETPCGVAVVRYRLAPEHRFPAPVEDCLAAAQWLAGQATALFLRPDYVAIGGTSAGANVAAATVLLARERAACRFAAQVLVYPVLRYGSTATVEESPLETFLGRCDVDWCWSHYLRSPTDGSSPLASPALAEDLDGLPPTLVLAGTLDPLLPEAELYAERLRRAGVPVELVRFDGVPHGFFSLSALSAADRAQREVVGMLRRVFGERR